MKFIFIKTIIIIILLYSSQKTYIHIIAKKGNKINDKF